MLAPPCYKKERIEKKSIIKKMNVKKRREKIYRLKKKREKDHSPFLDLCTKAHSPYTLVVYVA